MTAGAETSLCSASLWILRLAHCVGGSRVFLHQDMWHAHRCEQQTESWSSVRVSSLFPLTQLVPVKHSAGPGRAVCPYL